MDSKSVLESIGISVKENERYDFSTLTGKKCFGRLLDDPDFVGFEQLVSTADAIPEAHMIEPQQEGIDFGNKRFITVGDQYVSTVSDKYNLYQNKELMMNIVDAARQFDINPVGQINSKGGRMSGHMIFPGMESQVELLADTGEDIATGIHFANSYDGSKGVSLETMGIRTICMNYNMWGETGVSVKVGHNSNTLQDQLDKAFTDLIDRTSKLPAIVANAKDTVIAKEDVTDLLWGASFPIAAINGARKKNAVVPNLAKWSPEIETEGMNLWNVYNAGTAYLTHGGTDNHEGVEIHSRLLSKILNPSNFDTLVSTGADKRERFETKIAELKARKN